MESFEYFESVLPPEVAPDASLYFDNVEQFEFYNSCIEEVSLFLLIDGGYLLLS